MIGARVGRIELDGVLEIVEGFVDAARRWR